ncbi:MAG TPA: DNA recombination protein RmuC [Jatrophihabitantaceae bacterium]|jgi:DNA recombination protein RmuC
MDVTAVVLTLLALAVGLAIGWLLARQRAEVGTRVALTEAAGLRVALESERSGAAQREAMLVRTDAQLRELFGSQAAEALQRNGEAVIKLAEAQFAKTATAAGGDLAQRQQAIDALVSPLRESLVKVQQQLAEAEKGRATSDTALREQVLAMSHASEQVRSETSQLVTALRAPQIRGRWGEMQLERVVEAAGMTEHVDYETQASVTADDGSVQRPDLVVRLCGGKNVVVDSKVAFSAYLEAMEARDEATHDDRMKAHAKHLRAHIDSLSAKAYWERFSPTPEFVVCFVPADAFLDGALREEPTLLEYAFGKNVVLATPSTLVALLRTVAYSWRQEALAANAAEVHTLGRELYQRLSTMGGHIDKLGRSLGSAVSSYNQTVSSLESRVLVTARRMSDLKVVGPADLLDTPKQVTEAARSTQAPELTDQRVVALPKQRRVIGQTELPGAMPEAAGGRS